MSFCGCRLPLPPPPVSESGMMFGEFCQWRGLVAPSQMTKPGRTSNIVWLAMVLTKFCPSLPNSELLAFWEDRFCGKEQEVRTLFLPIDWIANELGVIVTVGSFVICGSHVSAQAETEYISLVGLN